LTGSGTLADPYVIWDLNDLQAVREYDAAYFELGADIDATPTAGWFGGAGFEPLDWPYPQKRQPTGDFASVGGWTVFPAVPGTLWDKVDELDQDGDATYIRIDALGGNVLFTIPNFNIPAGATNIELRMEIWGRVEGAPGDADGKIYIRVNGTNYQTANWRTVADELTYEHNNFNNDRFSTNPDTGLPWTVDDINGVGPNPLQAIGIVIKAGKICRITKIVAEVTCDPPTNLTFDGKGHDITSLTINRTVAGAAYDEHNVGLFRYLDGGEIKNINLVNCDIRGRWDVGGILSGSYWASGGISNCNVSGTIWSEIGGIGGIAAWMGYAGGNITNCHVTANLTCLRGYVGGIASYAFVMGGVGPLTIQNCSFTGTITAGAGWDYNAGIVAYASEYNIISCTAEGTITGGDKYQGGIAAYATDCNITDCVADMNITGGNYNGGLVGYYDCTVLFSHSILRSKALGNVFAPAGDYVGGLVGYLDWGQIQQSLASGDVTGDDYVGGLVGRSNGAISNSYAMGNVVGDTRVGGLVGNMGAFTVENSFSIGQVTGTANFGGLVGQNGGAVNDCFWDIETSGQASSDGGTGKTTEEMNHRDIYIAAGWDLATVWNISQVSTKVPTNITPSSAVLDGLLDLTIINEAYPFLRWQTVVELPCDCGFEWGETLDLGNFTPVDSKNTGDAFAQALSGLTPKTKYYFRARAHSSPGPIHGGIGTFTTAVGIEVETLPATNITENSARIWGVVRKVPITAMGMFDWGGSIDYGYETAWQPGLVSDDMFYVDLDNLAEGRAYHFRAVAMGSSLVYGNDMTFTTRSPLGPVTLIQEELAHIMEVS
jgi:hypothetical protein